MNPMTSCWPTAPDELYPLLLEQVKALVTPDVPVVSALANVSALLYEALPNVSWLGFYFIDGNELTLGPFQGKVACTGIKLGRGVCSAAVTMRSPLNVPDVDAFPGHIACDSASRSELVLPLLAPEPIGVLDIDSAVRRRFKQTDVDGLVPIAQAISEALTQRALPLA